MGASRVMAKKREVLMLQGDGWRSVKETGRVEVTHQPFGGLSPCTTVIILGGSGVALEKEATKFSEAGEGGVRPSQGSCSLCVTIIIRPSSFRARPRSVGCICI